jgi:hypothetical protein
MTAKRVRAPKKTNTSETPGLVYKINTLLHTMRCIEQHEQELCTLMNEIRSKGTVSAEAEAELRSLIGKMPHRDYVDDLDAVSEAVGATAAS